MSLLSPRLILRLAAISLTCVSLAACMPAEGNDVASGDVDIFGPGRDGGTTGKDTEPDPTGDGGATPEVGPDWDGPRFRIATLNVRRFFDTVCDSGSCDAQAYERVLSEVEFDYRAAQIADALETLDADAYLLQELEKEVNLDAIAELLGAEYSVAEFGEAGYIASLDVGIITRGELLEVRKHRNSTNLERPDGSSTTFAREFLEVHVDRGGHRVVVFTTHFKAKANDDPGRRYAEAVGAREIVEATADEFPDALVVLGGDLNDEVGSAPIDALTSGDLSLITRATDPDAYWTYSYGGDRIGIDHLLIASTGGGAYVSGSVRVVREGSSGFGGSDHAAVVADFGLVAP